jgi:hypothetical protein
MTNSEMISKMIPYVDDLVKSLQSYGIVFIPTDGELENVIFTNGTKTVKIAHKCFYRFSGMCRIQKDKVGGKHNEVEFVEVTDKIFICTYMGTIIKRLFKII